MSLFNMNYEVRTTGHHDNGGGYFPRVGGVSVDYSQQDAAELILTDLVCVEDTMKVTSVTGGFTPGMMGNLMNITSGTNFVVGRYEIVLWEDGNTVYLDRSPATAGAGSAGNCRVGGAVTDFFDIAEFDHDGIVRIWIKEGTYTLDEAVAMVSNDVVFIYGYNGQRNIPPQGDDRPLIVNTSSYGITYPIRFQVNNIRFRGDGSAAYSNADGNFFNCKFEISSIGSAGMPTGDGMFDNCEFVNDSGVRNKEGPQGSFFRHCYFKNFITAIRAGAIGAKAHFCIVNDCDLGQDYVSSSGGQAVGNTYYSCSEGIEINTGAPIQIILNCIFAGCTTAIDNSAATEANSRALIVEYCDFWNNGVDISDPYHDMSNTNIFVDPNFINPGADDFSLALGSPVIGMGQAMELGVS